jgi:hypothetical protein
MSAVLSGCPILSIASVVFRGAQHNLSEDRADHFLEKSKLFVFPILLEATEDVPQFFCDV